MNEASNLLIACNKLETAAEAMYAVTQTDVPLPSEVRDALDKLTAVAAEFGLAWLKALDKIEASDVSPDATCLECDDLCVCFPAYDPASE